LIAGRPCHNTGITASLTLGWWILIEGSRQAAVREVNMATGYESKDGPRWRPCGLSYRHYVFVLLKYTTLKVLKGLLFIWRIGRFSVVRFHFASQRTS
jgi:hypothetical protein